MWREISSTPTASAQCTKTCFPFKFQALQHKHWTAASTWNFCSTPAQIQGEIRVIPKRVSLTCDPWSNFALNCLNPVLHVSHQALYHHTYSNPNEESLGWINSLVFWIRFRIIFTTEPFLNNYFCHAVPCSGVVPPSKLVNELLSFIPVNFGSPKYNCHTNQQGEIQFALIT